MMKKFVHKTLWREAKEKNIRFEQEKQRMYLVKRPNSKQWFYIHPELIEWCDERKEFVEKDWITNARDEYWILNKRNTDAKQDFREAIEKHAPKVKKFTEQEVQRWNEMNFRMCPDTICDFLRVNWLLKE